MQKKFEIEIASLPKEENLVAEIFYEGIQKIVNRLKLHSLKGLKMDRKNVSSGSPMEGPIGFSRASRIGNVIAVAGTAAIGLDGQTVGINDVYEQTKCCIEIQSLAIVVCGGGNV